MKFLACCVPPDRKLYGNCLYWLNILYWKFFHLALTNSLPWNFPLYFIHFLPFRIFEQLALVLKTEFALKIFTALSILLHSGFFSILRLPWKTELTWKVSLYWNIFYHSGLLSNFRLPWKQRVPWIHCIEYKSFTIQDFWATCACPEKHKLPWNFSLY